MTPEMVEIREFAEQILKDRVFMGNFYEKRYVKSLNSYRDVIVLDKDEVDLRADLIKVRNFSLARNPNGWLGFSEPHDIDAPPAVYCIWTVLDKCDRTGDGLNVATTVFGDYWFQIKAIHLAQNAAIEMEMKILRPIKQMASTLSNSSALTIAHQAINDIDTTKIQQYFRENVVEVNWIQLFQQWCEAINQTAYQFLFHELNWHNILHWTQMIGLFLMATFKLSVYLIQWLGEFTLKLVFELTKLCRAITPISITILNLIGKVIGGFYILLAMIWRDSFGSNQRMATTTANMKTAYNRPATGYRRDYSMPNNRTFKRRNYLYDLET